MTHCHDCKAIIDRQRFTLTKRGKRFTLCAKCLTARYLLPPIAADTPPAAPPDDGEGAVISVGEA